MVKKSFQAAFAFFAVIALMYPFVHEVSGRTAIQRDLLSTLNANDAAALREWSGSAESFAAMLYDRCLRTNGGRIAACERYRTPGG